MKDEWIFRDVMISEVIEWWTLYDSTYMTLFKIVKLIEAEGRKVFSKDWEEKEMDFINKYTVSVMQD